MVSQSKEQMARGGISKFNLSIAILEEMHDNFKEGHEYRKQGAIDRWESCLSCVYSTLISRVPKNEKEIKEKREDIHKINITAISQKLSRNLPLSPTDIDIIRNKIKSLEDFEILLHRAMDTKKMGIRDEDDVEAML